MKSEIRSRLLQQLKTLDSGQKSAKSSAIQANLVGLLKNKKGFWAGYFNLSDEPSIVWPQISENIAWCFPVVQDEALQFKTAATSYEKSSLGVAEPQDGEAVSLEQIEGFVIPGVGFDKKGFRLGRGRGFYDRTLAAYQGKKIGLCYELALCDELPHEAHDIPCDSIVTENSIYQSVSSEGDSKWR